MRTLGRDDLEKFMFLLLLLFLVSFFFTGCHLNYKEAMLSKELSKNIPNVVFINFKNTVVKNNSIVAVVEARRGEEYLKKNEIRLEKVRYREFTEDGKIADEGSAESAIYNTKSKDAEIVGSIKIRSEIERGEITAQRLYWSNDKRKLTGEPDEEVKLKQDDGSFVIGKGFSSDLRLKEIRFSGEVQGKYIGKKKDEKK